MCSVFFRIRIVFTLKSWKINERNLLVNTCFQKKCDLPNKSKLQILFWMHYFATNNQYWAFPYYILLFFSGQCNKNHNFLSVIEWVASALVYALLLSKVDVRGHSQTMLTKFCPFLTTYLPLHMCPVWHLWRNSFTVIRGKCAYRWHFQDHLSTSSCKRSLWTSH